MLLCAVKYRTMFVHDTGRLLYLNNLQLIKGRFFHRAIVSDKKAVDFKFWWKRDNNIFTPTIAYYRLLSPKS